jgi:hypothetical protein
MQISSQLREFGGHRILMDKFGSLEQGIAGHKHDHGGRTVDLLEWRKLPACDFQDSASWKHTPREVVLRPVTD